jgi:hypothetical protein
MNKRKLQDTLSLYRVITLFFLIGSGFVWEIQFYFELRFR